MRRTANITQLESPELCKVFHDIFICLEAISGYATMLIDGAVRFAPGDYVCVESRRGHFQIRLPLHGPVAAALAGQRPHSMQIEIEPRIETRQYACTTDGLQQAIDGVLFANFLRYYVTGATALAEALGSDWRWGKHWRFAWVLRNALAHDGRLAFRNAQKNAVEWDGLRYDASDNELPVFERDIGAADLILLMIDMDIELRRSQI